MDGDLGAVERIESARERLLRAALRSFAAVGFEAASTRVIAAEAGVQQGLVRHHFGSKAGLFAAVLDAAATQLEGDLEALEPLSVEAFLALVARHAEPARLAAHALLAPGTPGETVRARLEPLYQRVLQLQRSALGSTPEAELRARMWLASAFVASALHPGAASSSSRSRAAGDVLFTWLCAEPPRAATGPFSIDAARARLRG